MSFAYHKTVKTLHLQRLLNVCSEAEISSESEVSATSQHVFGFWKHGLEFSLFS